MELRCEHFIAADNLEQQRDLFKDCFPETNGEKIQEKEHYYWKFHSYPTESEKSWEYVSYFDTDMVGYYAALPYRYKIGDSVSTIGMVCDVMTSSKYRGKGIFTKMGVYSTGELAKFVPFSTGFPIRKEVIPGHLKVGWKIAFDMPLYIKFLRMDSFLKFKHLGFLKPIANFCISIYNFTVHSPVKKKYTCSVFSDINSICDYNNLMREWGQTISNSLIKDVKFAKWRYGAPGRTYRFLEIKKRDKLVAFVSFRRIIKENVPSYGILDFVCLPENKDCIGLVIRELTNLAKSENVEAIMTMMSRTSASQYKLLTNGFLKSPFRFYFIVKRLTDKFGEADLLNEKNWHLMWVDSDDL